jgi:hypothetical protein
MAASGSIPDMMPLTGAREVLSTDQTQTVDLFAAGPRLPLNSGSCPVDGHDPWAAIR